jgi:hypothetical protein
MVLSQFSSVQSAIETESPSIPALLSIINHKSSYGFSTMKLYISTFRNIAFNKKWLPSKSVRLYHSSTFMPIKKQ